MSTSQENQKLKINFQEEAIKAQIWSCCYNCDYWMEQEENCGFYNTRPPVKVIITGCPVWLNDIPF